jgi:hypothetical protein
MEETIGGYTITMDPMDVTEGAGVMGSMKRDRLIVVGVAVVAIGIGGYLFLTGNFSSTVVPTTSQDQTATVTVPFTTLLSGSQSTVSTRVNYFITSPDQLSELWKMINATSTPPKVDFNKEAIIAVFAGQQPTTGYAINISKIVDSSARLVSVTIVKPDSSCITGQSFTAPFELVTVPATTLPLAHEDLSTTTKCN